MSLIAPERSVPGRQLMVPDDAESIARGARRRAHAAARRRMIMQQVIAGAGALAIVAVLIGVPPLVAACVLVVLAVSGSLGWQRLQQHQAALRRRRERAVLGTGIGAPRPDGGFSLTRHRVDPDAVRRSAA